MEADFAAVLVAGGRSRRMGATDKAFVEFRGGPLWLHQLRRLRSLGPAEVLISANAEQEFEPPGGVGLVCDAVPDQGPLGGLATALGRCRQPLALVLAVDLPLVEPGWLRQAVLGRCRRSPGGDAVTGAVPVSSRGFEPLAACYPTSLAPLADARVRAGQLSLQEFVAAAEAAGAVETFPLSDAELDQFANLNSPADLAAIGSDGG